MLRSLLDEHLSPDIARQIRRRRPDVPVECLQEWRGGTCLGCDDAALLSAAFEEGLTLVTRDQRTIGSLLRLWGEVGKPHSGVVFLSPGAFSRQVIGGLATALEALCDARANDDWTGAAINLTS